MAHKNCSESKVAEYMLNKEYDESKIVEYMILEFHDCIRSLNLKIDNEFNIYDQEFDDNGELKGHYKKYVEYMFFDFFIHDKEFSYIKTRLDSDSDFIESRVYVSAVKYMDPILRSVNDFSIVDMCSKIKDEEISR
jgi:hypothetical protein